MFFHVTKQLVAGLAALFVSFVVFTAPAAAAVEVNSADPAQLETVKGIGPALSGKILAERKQGNFKDWSDFEARVAGVGDRNAAAFSRAGLTVDGKAKDGAQAGSDAATTARTANRKGPGEPANASLAKK